MIEEPSYVNPSLKVSASLFSLWSEDGMLNATETAVCNLSDFINALNVVLSLVMTILIWFLNDRVSHIDQHYNLLTGLIKEISPLIM